MFYISKENWDKIIGYARAREEQEGHEIGGMAVILKDVDDDYVIDEPVILKQTTTAATCTMDKEALANYYVEMAHKHGKDVNFLWWHSHAKMKAFWSGTDTDTMTEYNNGKWSAFLVVNVREEHKFSVQYWDPVEKLIDDELNVVNQLEQVIDESIMNEVTALCSKETSLVKPQIWQNYSAKDGWTGGYGQSYMWEPNKGPFKKDASDPTALDDIVNYAEKLLEQYCAGSLKKRAWNKEVKDYNVLLETAKLPNDLIEDLEGNPVVSPDPWDNFGGPS